MTKRTTVPYIKDNLCICCGIRRARETDSYGAQLCGTCAGKERRKVDSSYSWSTNTFSFSDWYNGGTGYQRERY